MCARVCVCIRVSRVRVCHVYVCVYVCVYVYVCVRVFLARVCGAREDPSE